MPQKDERDAIGRYVTWERHGQTFLLALMTAVLFFAARTLWDNNAVQAKMTEQIAALGLQVAKLEGTVSAMQQQYVTRPEFSVHEQRIQSIEAGQRK